MKVEHTKSGNIKIVISREQAVSLEKVLGNMAYDDIKRVVAENNPSVTITREETNFIFNMWDRLDDVIAECHGY